MTRSKHPSATNFSEKDITIKSADFPVPASATKTADKVPDNGAFFVSDRLLSGQNPDNFSFWGECHKKRSTNPLKTCTSIRMKENFYFILLITFSKYF